MKTVVVKRRRTGYHGEKLVWVLCPVCRAGHWIPDNITGECVRRAGAPFAIRAESSRP